MESVSLPTKNDCALYFLDANSHLLYIPTHSSWFHFFLAIPIVSREDVRLHADILHVCETREVRDESAISGII